MKCRFSQNKIDFRVEISHDFLFVPFLYIQIRSEIKVRLILNKRFSWNKQVLFSNKLPEEFLALILRNSFLCLGFEFSCTTIREKNKITFNLPMFMLRFFSIDSTVFNFCSSEVCCCLETCSNILSFLLSWKEQIIPFFWRLQTLIFIFCFCKVVHLASSISITFQPLTNQLLILSGISAMKTRIKKTVGPWAQFQTENNRMITRSQGKGTTTTDKKNSGRKSKDQQRKDKLSSEVALQKRPKVFYILLIQQTKCFLLWFGFFQRLFRK